MARKAFELQIPGGSLYLPHDGVRALQRVGDKLRVHVGSAYPICVDDPGLAIYDAIVGALDAPDDAPDGAENNPVAVLEEVLSARDGRGEE